MPDALAPIPLTEAAFAEVGQFDFGSEYYQRELLHWLLEESPAAMQAGTRIWLYSNARYEIVGFGSLGHDCWEVAGTDIEMLVIPAVALRREFWGQPAGVPRLERYSYLILDHLAGTATASLRKSTGPAVLGLLVHPKNVRAIGLYRSFGFEKFSYSYTVPGTRKRYDSYVLPLPRENPAR